jgi:hypothetical protein
MYRKRTFQGAKWLKAGGDTKLRKIVETGDKEGLV